MPNNFKKRFNKMLDYEIFRSMMEQEGEMFADYDNYLDFMKEFEGK